MRLLMQKGKQREFLEKEKELFGFGWNQFANHLFLKFGKLNSFHYEEALIDDVTFNRLNLAKFYKKFIMKKFSNNWGKIKGGKNSSGNTKEIKIPKKDEKLAEFWGILLGDGHVDKIKKYKVGIYHVKVTGHSVDDKKYLLYFVKPLLENLFNVSVRIHYSKHSKALDIIADGRKIVDFFEQNAFKAGNKIINKVTIPDWIKEDKKLLSSCLRGLYDTDGSFYRLTNQNSYQIHFKNHNPYLLKDVHDSLLNLGISVSKIMKSGSIIITRKSEIEKFYKLIGFSNSKHLNKIKKLF